MKGIGSRQNVYFLKFRAKKDYGQKQVKKLLSYELRNSMKSAAVKGVGKPGETEYRGFRLFEAVHNGNERFVIAEPVNVNAIITKIKETVITAETFEEAKRKIDENYT